MGCEHVLTCWYSVLWCVYIFISPLVLMASSKWPRHDENTSFSFVDQSTPTTKCWWLKAQPVTLVEIKNIQQEQAKKGQAAAEVRAQAEVKAWVEQVLGSITAAGYETLYGFVDKLLNICDQQLSSHVSNMLGTHGIQELLQPMTELLQYYDLNIFLPLQLPWCKGSTLNPECTEVNLLWGHDQGGS